LTARVFRPAERLVPAREASFVADLAEVHIFDAGSGVRLNRTADAADDSVLASMSGAIPVRSG